MTVLCLYRRLLLRIPAAARFIIDLSSVGSILRGYLTSFYSPSRSKGRTPQKEDVDIEVIKIKQVFYVACVFKKGDMRKKCNQPLAATLTKISRISCLALFFGCHKFSGVRIWHWLNGIQSCSQVPPGNFSRLVCHSSPASPRYLPQSQGP